jgi:LysR family cyn operon transcriptional activator
MFEELLNASGLSYERLSTLLKLSETGSLIQAADHDLGKQSRFSHHLRELSEYFGVELTEKVGRSVGLTAAGRALVQLAREHFLALQSFRDQVRGNVSTIRIAADESLLQWLVVPAIAQIRSPSRPVRFVVESLQRDEIVQRLGERRIEFGLLPVDSVAKPLKHAFVEEQGYSIFVPRRLLSTRGGLTVRDALLSCPHAAVGGEGRLGKQVAELAQALGGTFNPQLVCDSIGQCVAAVESGAFAAVLPSYIRPSTLGSEYEVVDDASLDRLRRRIALTWHSRSAEVMGASGARMRAMLIEAMKE